MKKVVLLAFALLSFASIATAQMQIGGETRYGNEWIHYDQTYYKIMVAKDGVYRIPASTLPAAFDTVPANRIRMYYFGEEIPIYTTTQGVMSDNDYIEFYGMQNRGEMDKFLYADWEDQFNPYYSLFTDTSAYFLTWDPDILGKRFLDVEPDWMDLPEKEAFYWAKMIYTPGNALVKNKVPGAQNKVERSLFENAEGWCYKNPANLTLPLSQAFTSYSDSVSITVTYANLNADIPQEKKISINGIPYSNDYFTMYEGKKNTFLIPSSILSGSSISINGGDRTGLACVEMEYPRLFNASGDSLFVFWIKSSDSRKYIEIENFAANGSLPVLYDLTNEILIPVVLDGNLVKVVLPESSLDRKLVLVNEKGIKNITPPKQVQFIDYSQSDAEFLIVFNKVIAVDGNGVNQVEAYADHRNSTFTTDTFEIQQLYDQFAYGIQRHPMAIKNLVFYAKENWTNPQYLLLIGKGREYQDMRSSTNVTNNLNKHFFIPTFGFKGADHLFACPAGSIDPVLSVGRLPVVNADEIRIYLDKVIEFEQAQDPLSGNQTIADKAWMKRVMHLGGGRNEEKAIIKSHLTGMENTIRNNQFGGIVKAFYNTSSEPVMTSATGEIIQQINNGLSLLTFFGHSSATLLDFNFDDPAAYDNQGKYPVMLSFGCLSGEMYDTSRSLGERFILADKKGMIAFISSPGFGFISSLNVLGSNYYSRLGGNMYGQSIGNILKESLKILGTSGFHGDLMLGEQTSIQGDPSLVLNPLPGPDYLPDPQSVKISPPLLTTSLDSFQISLDLWNIGYNLPDTTFVLKIEHELPDNSSFTILTDTIAAPASMASVQYSLPIIEDDQALVGVNRFIITVDAADDIEEKPLAAENNNTYIHPVYISSADAEPLYPANFGIINYSPVTLNASTGNPFFPQLTYWMEIDTTELFDSAFKQSTSISQSGGVIKWTPDIALQPNTVYYWRVSPDSSLTGSYRWRSSSFVYLPNSSPGWNQSHYYQFQYGNFVDMKMDSTTRKIAFIDDVVDFKIRNNARNLNLKNPRYLRNQEDFYPVPAHQEYWGQIPAGLFFAVMDPINLKPIKISSIPGIDWTPSNLDDTYSYNKSFLFRTTDFNHRAQIITFLKDSVPDEHYVLMFTCQNGTSANYMPHEWDNDTIGGTSLFDFFEQQGATQIRDLATLGSRPYNLFYQKNHPDTVYEKIGDFQTQTELNISVPGSWTEGSLTSPPIGPAQKWETLEYQLTDLNPAHDLAKIRIWGLPASGSDTLLYDNVLDKTWPFALDQIDATLFPRLKLEYFAWDTTQKTPPHLNYWRIHYQGVPEAALDPAGYFSLQSDTLLQGAPLLLEVATENLSDYNMDSLLVRYTILNPQNQATNIEHRYRPLPARDTLIAHLQYDTRPTTGVHQLTIDVNPDDDQPEQTHINNVGILQFFVEQDLRNPLLDVTFDGEHILDGDLVSTTPFIQVQLKDENPYLALEDTSLFRLLLLHPNGMEERLSFADERIRFFPAEIQNGKNNRARIEFSPTFTQDGEYALFVEAEDATGNKTGDLDYKVSTLNNFGQYKISFKVFTESMISNVLNYPNPFSTSTRFLYTLTGSEPPAYFTIQILTVSGRVVREITQHEIGTMKIGTHLTDYAWDGRDEFGDPLANGVYLYRIVAKKANGENFKAFASGADAFFNKGYGKMVIIR